MTGGPGAGPGSGPAPGPGRESGPGLAAALVAAARLVAERLSAGGRLLAHGEGRCLADAQHIAVEFLHPVITGRPALPALVGAAGRTIGDVVVSVAYGGTAPAPTTDVMLTDRLDGPNTPAGADPPVVIPLPAGPEAKEAAVVAYHILWETAHLFLDTTTCSPSRADPEQAGQVAPAVAALYPMLYSPSASTRDGAFGDDPGDRPLDNALEAAALESVRAKLEESAAVRRQARRDNAGAIDRAAALLRRAPTVFTCGNGGSATDAADLAHLLGDRGRSLSGDIATVTALTNDVSFDVAFARPLATLGRPGDALVALSTSGSSSNVLAALAGARAKGMVTVALAGYGGGAMRSCDPDVLLAVNSDSVHRIQEAQVALYTDLATRSAKDL